MITMEKMFEVLKGIDEEVAENYLFQLSYAKSLRVTLDRIRELLEVKEGDSIIGAVEALVDPPAVITAEPTPVTRTRSSKEEREDVKQRLMSLGITFKAKDSTKRLMKKLQNAEAVPSDIAQEFNIEPTPTTPVYYGGTRQDGPSKQKNVINGW